MAVSLVQGKTVDTTGTSTTCQLTSPPANNGLLFSTTRAGTGTGITISFSDSSSNTWSTIDQTTDGPLAADDTYGDGYAVNGATPPTNPTVTISAAGNGTGTLRGIVEEYSGVVSSAPLNDHGSVGATTGTAISIATGSTTTNSGDLVIGVAGNHNGQTFTHGASYATGDTVPATPKLATEWKAATAGGSQTANGSWGASDTWAGLIATFKAAGGGPTPALVDIIGRGSIPVPRL